MAWQNIKQRISELEDKSIQILQRIDVQKNRETNKTEKENDQDITDLWY